MVLLTIILYMEWSNNVVGAQSLSGRVLDLRPRGQRFEPHWRHCAVVLEQDSLVLFQPRKTYPCLTERLLMGLKNQIKQTNKTNNVVNLCKKNHQ